MLSLAILSTLNAAPVPTLPSDPVQLFDNTWLPIIVSALQVLAFFGLVVTVIINAFIARANQTSAEAAQKATESAVKSVHWSEQAVAEMKAARDAETAPYVVVFLDGNDFIVRLVMENFGRTAARDISLHFEPELDPAIGISREGWPAFMTGTTPNLAPKQHMTAFINAYPALVHNPNLKPQYIVTVTYHGGATAGEHKIERLDSYVLDVNSFLGVELPGESDAEKTVSELRGLVKAVETVNSTIGNVSDRLDVGVAINAGTAAEYTPQGASDNLATGIHLCAGLRVLWQVIEEKRQAHALVSGFERSLAMSRSEQLATLIPFMPLNGEDLEKAQRLALQIQGSVRRHFRIGYEAEVDMMVALDDLLALLRTQHPRDIGDEDSVD